MRLFILATLFLTLSLALSAMSAPATNYLEGCPPATLKETTDQRFSLETPNQFGSIYFSQDRRNPFEARECEYCGGMTSSCCATVCGCLGYSYYKCLECQCGCGN